MFSTVLAKLNYLNDRGNRYATWYFQTEKTFLTISFGIDCDRHLAVFVHRISAKRRGTLTTIFVFYLQLPLYPLRNGA